MLAEFNHISLLICLVPFYFLLHEDKALFPEDGQASIRDQLTRFPGNTQRQLQQHEALSVEAAKGG